MKNGDELIKSMEEYVGKLKRRADAEDVLAEMVDFYKKSYDEKKKIITGDKYILWLESFTRDRLTFSDEQWLYYPEKISSEDRENVEKLSLLYSGIDEYAQENYIYPDTSECEGVYSIKYKGVGFKIGLVVGQGSVCFCERVAPREDFINFKDIQANKKHTRTDFINNKLQELSNLIDSYNLEGVPLEAISNTTKKTIKRILSKDK